MTKPLPLSSALLRQKMSPLLDEALLEAVAGGESGARVLRVLRDGCCVAFLKYATGSLARDIELEADCQRWLAPRISVPPVLACRTDADGTFLLSSALAGGNARAPIAGAADAICRGLGEALRRLHALPVNSCPFQRGLSVQLAFAESRMQAGLVDAGDFDASSAGRSVAELFSLLVDSRPPIEDWVVAHGDACPENAIFLDGQFQGFIDCGRLGVADRYQDLALASRNIGAIFGAHCLEQFFVAYGEESPDLKKLEYFRLLDEFF